MRRSLGTVVLASVLVSISALRAGSTSQRNKIGRRKAAPVSLATQRGADTITAAQLKEYLSFIASDEMEGRDTPSRGLDITAKFLATNLSRWGFKGAGGDGTLFQKIGMRRESIDTAGTRVQLNDQPLFSARIIFRRSSAAMSCADGVRRKWMVVKSKSLDPYRTVDPRERSLSSFRR